MQNRRHRRLARLAVLLCMVVLAPLIAACGGQPGGAQPGGATAPAAGETTPAQEPGTGQAAAGDLAPPEQQILRVRLVAYPETIDPALDENTSEEAVIKQLFTGLTRMNTELKPEPAIAESWEFNADNTQITFKLRESKWSDGQPLTAKDFVYGWQRFLDPRTASPYAALVTGVIAGANELNTTPVSDTAVLEQAISGLGVRAVDDLTFQVDLASPAPFFPSIVALGNLSPIRKDLIDQYGDTWVEPGRLIGNGPFILQSATAGADLILVPNPNYYESPPKLQQLIFRTINDDPTALANYRADEIDLNDQLPPAELPALRADPTFADQILSGTRLGNYFYGFNSTQPPFSDVRVRRAFALAVDRKTLIDQVLNGRDIPAHSFIPPGMPGHITLEEAGEAAQVFDPEKAKALLAEAGFPGGQGFPPLTIAFNNCCSHDLIAQRVQSDLQTNLGVQVELEPREATTYFGEVRRNPPPLWRQAWIGDYPDPYDWDYLVFGPESDQNYGGWSNDEYTALLDRAAAATNEEERIDLYKQAEKILAEDAGALFIYYYGRAGLVKPWVSGLSFTAQDPVLGAYSYKDAQILAH
ncbi:MAG: peptide ABC transporter substrate-binding protein [Chloroflexales bacterium]|nr:peptide ABC transporter substrate-binding protein [Chloroflexales bacterium]